MLMSTEASGQPTIDDDGTCDRGLATSEQVANLIDKVDKVLASNSQQPTCTPTTVDVSKRALISALKSECRFHKVPYSCLYIAYLNRTDRQEGDGRRPL